MDRLLELLKTVETRSALRRNFLGLLHVLIGRRITLNDGTLVSAGSTWRELAALFKHVRWERECVAELGLNAGELPPRDRERFWYAVIARAGVDSPAASAAGDRLAATLRTLGYEVSPAPSRD